MTTLTMKFKLLVKLKKDVGTPGKIQIKEKLSLQLKKNLYY